MRRGTWMLALGVVGALLVGEAALRIIEPSIPTPSPWPSVETQVKSAQLADLSQEVDVLLLGSSITEAAVDPELLMSPSNTGVAYNSALPFSTPLSDEVWLNEVALRHISPSIVIIGVPVWPPHSTAETDVLRPGIEEATSALSTRGIAGISALIRNKGVLADWDERWTGLGLSSSELWTDLGQTTGYYDRPVQSLAGRFPPYGPPAMSSDNRAALTRTVSMLTGAGIGVALMIEPGFYPGQVSDSDVESYLGSIREFGEELGVPVWDTYSRGWDSSLYVDEAHFNREGTIAFTTYLAGLVSELDP